MKKTYMKPELAIETFSLSQSIAAGCGRIPQGEKTLTEPDNCSFMLGPVRVFSSTPTCEATPDGNSVCYNNPNPEQAIFYS